MNISILGCGWMGRPLGRILVDQGHTVHGSTTTPDKKKKLRNDGIIPYHIKLNPDFSKKNEAFWKSDLLYLNIPPGRGKKNVEDFFPAQIEAVTKRLESSTIQQVIFASSTSVYPSTSQVVSENDAQPGKAGRPSGNAQLKAEELITGSDHFNATILRFGGLYGYDRHPVRYLAGKNDLPGGNAPVNLIHRDDCIQIILQIMQKPFINDVFNAVSDGHPPREMYYRAAAKKLGLKPPTFSDDSSTNCKVVSNHKLKSHLDYQFIHPNPMNLDTELVED